MQQLSVFIVKTMRYEQLIGVSVGVQMREILRRVQLNVAGLEAIITQCPPHFRQITTFHVRQLNMNIKYLTEQVQRMLRQTAAIKAQSLSLRQVLQHHCAIVSTIQQVTTIVFCSIMMTQL